MVSGIQQVSYQEIKKISVLFRMQMKIVLQLWDKSAACTASIAGWILD